MDSCELIGREIGQIKLDTGHSITKIEFLAFPYNNNYYTVGGASVLIVMFKVSLILHMHTVYYVIQWFKGCPSIRTAIWAPIIVL